MAWDELSSADLKQRSHSLGCPVRPFGDGEFNLGRWRSGRGLRHLDLVRSIPEFDRDAGVVDVIEILAELKAQLALKAARRASDHVPRVDRQAVYQRCLGREVEGRLAEGDALPGLIMPARGDIGGGKCGGEVEHEVRQRHAVLELTEHETVWANGKPYDGTGRGGWVEGIRSIDDLKYSSSRAAAADPHDTAANGENLLELWGDVSRFEPERLHAEAPNLHRRTHPGDQHLHVPDLDVERPDLRRRLFLAGGRRRALHGEAERQALGQTGNLHHPGGGVDFHGVGRGLQRAFVRKKSALATLR